MSNYWSVTEFLADAQKMPCKTRYDVPDAGHLDGSSEQHLRAGASLDLPFWLVGTLTTKDMIELHLPKPYSARVRNALSAAPESVDLRNLGGGGGAFYAGGLRLDGLTDDPTLLRTLNASFTARLPGVMDQSQHTAAHSRTEGAAYEFGQQLDSWEKELFTRGEVAARSLKTWTDSRTKPLPNASR